MSFDPLKTNRQALQRLLRQTGMTPRRSAGQNFLIDSTVVETLVEAAAVQADDKVLEIGPGFGAVTDLLLERGATVLAVELDQRLGQYLSARYRARQDIEVVVGDASALRLDRLLDDGGYTLVSSLPFNITSLVLRNFLERAPRPRRISLLVQDEVAKRVTAEPGAMSLVSVAVQYLGTPTYGGLVSRESFWPVPEVNGALLAIDVLPMPPAHQRKRLFRIARIGFSRRRKMLHNNLDSGLSLERGTAEKKLREIGLNPHCRAQDLSVGQWLRLAEKLL